MTLKKVKKDALEHYDAMIAFVEKEIKNGMKWTDGLYRDMLHEINQVWESEDCSFCQEYILTCKRPGGCPLSSICPDKGSWWYRMNKVKTTKTWLKYAKKIRKFIYEVEV